MRLCGVILAKRFASISDKPVRGEIEGPADNQRDRKAECEQHDDHRVKPYGQPQWRLDGLGDLHEQPSRDAVDGRNLEDLASFDFGQN